jgi:hypothetical protein
VSLCSVSPFIYHHAECRYAQRRCAECHSALQLPITHRKLRRKKKVLISLRPGATFRRSRGCKDDRGIPEDEGGAI